MLVRRPTGETEHVRRRSGTPVAVGEVVVSCAAVEPGLGGLCGGEQAALGAGDEQQSTPAGDPNTLARHVRGGYREVRIDRFDGPELREASIGDVSADAAKPSRFS